MVKNSTDIWSRLSEVLNADNLDEVAKKLGLNASTLRGRKAREAIPYEQIVQNLDVYDLVYVFKDKKINKPVDLLDGINQKDIEKGNLSEIEQYLDKLVQDIEEGPFSSKFKLRMVASLMRIADDNLKNFQEEITRVPLEER
ncbi:hypothetical protein [Fodinibius salsisoli]|uniref:Uncharacterized protein n=1 Tax=Fodinibius salsisoli TaxID=2820877 RepID=A0ABT3PK25_9BACT|nr:hypothetical protein [Fodinibius salsisoli]MCW9706274.1 hypothetical protein [Fodinibius salsisoli]